MGNMCCRRVAYSPNGTEVDKNRCQQNQQQQQQQLSKTQTMSSAYHNGGDDCAINELLEGRMDLDVILPDSRQVRLTVERRTPMMDLLVQAASATKINPVGHVIHVFGDSGKGSGTLQYKPSTPIGSLDTNTICIVPKKDVQEPTLKRAQRLANRPFEPTFRVQVRLPRNQLTVVRVSPRVKITELRNMVCKEKGLETCKYQLVRPSDPTQALSGDLTLAEYGSTEITLLSNSSIESNICNSTSHIMPYSKRVEDQKKKTGILRLLAEDDNKKEEKKMVTNGNHRFVPTKVNDNNVHQGRYKPKKRRPAPPPPPPVLPDVPFHSRQSSSDSSGYHEATSSFLHEEHCVTSDEKASSDSSGVSSLDAKVTTVEAPPIPNAKKRKAPPPPPSHLVAVHRTTEKTADSQTKPKFEEHCMKQEKDHHQEGANEERQSTELTSNEVEVESKTEDQKEEKVAVGYHHSEKESVNELKMEKNAESRINEKKLNQSSIKIEDQRVMKRIRDEQMVKQINDCQMMQKPEKSQTVQKDQKKMEEVEKAKESQLPISINLNINSYASRNNISANSDEKEVLAALQCKSKQLPTENGTLKTLTNKESKVEKKSKTNEPVTRVALVALNAKIEQDVTQQEIASSIQAAFHSLDIPQKIKPSLVSIKQKTLQLEGYPEPVTSGDSCNESTDKNVLPQIQAKDLNATDGIVNNPYPLQKSSAVLSLNSDIRDDIDIGIETVLPPPTEFRCDEIESSSGSDESKQATESSPLNDSKVLKRSSSLLSLENISHHHLTSKPNTNKNLQRSLSNIKVDYKEVEFEQEKLQREYIELQKQFILWQKQVIKNQAMLREESVVPQYARTLRQSHSLPEGEDDTQSSIPLVSRSLSYEPTKSVSSTLPRSAINIPSLELISLPINNGSSTLRSSKNKSYFKPPQVRVTTKSRQRLPPVILKDGELDGSKENKISSPLLPAFDSLKLITEHKEEETNMKESNEKNAMSTVKSENNHNRKLQEETKFAVLPQNPNKLATLPKPQSKLNNGIIFQNGNNTVHLKHMNKDNDDQSNGLPAPVKTTEQSTNSLPPPPPPLPTPSQKPRETKTFISNKTSCVQNKVIKKEFQPESDPREQLMQEIRRFGGRTALRKISLAS